MPCQLPVDRPQLLGDTVGSYDETPALNRSQSLSQSHGRHRLRSRPIEEYQSSVMPWELCAVKSVDTMVLDRIGADASESTRSA